MNFSKSGMFPGRPLPRIDFDEVAHRYFHEGHELRSVGSIVRRWKPEFDSVRWSAHVAERDSLTNVQVLAQWKAQSDLALAKGSRIHSHIEDRLNNLPTNCHLPEAAAWDAWWAKAGLVMDPRATELIVGWPEMRVAGTIDSLMWSLKTSQFHIFDWKTGRKFRTTHDRNYKTFLLAPFNDLPDCELSIYSMQVSLYRHILRQLGVPTGSPWIIHLSDTVATPHKALDLEARMALTL